MSWYGRIEIDVNVGNMSEKNKEKLKEELEKKTELKFKIYPDELVSDTMSDFYYGILDDLKKELTEIKKKWKTHKIVLLCWYLEEPSEEFKI